MSDYLAIIQANGVGSWARSKDRKTAIDNVVQMFHSDFKTILKPENPKPTVKISLYDVEGNDKVWWDDFGIYGDKDEDLSGKREVVEHTYSKW